MKIHIQDGNSSSSYEIPWQCYTGTRYILYKDGDSTPIKIYDEGTSKSLGYGSAAGSDWGGRKRATETGETGNTIGWLRAWGDQKYSGVPAGNTIRMEVRKCFI